MLSSNICAGFRNAALWWCPYDHLMTMYIMVIQYMHCVCVCVCPVHANSCSPLFCKFLASPDYHPISIMPLNLDEGFSSTPRVDNIMNHYKEYIMML